MVLPPDQKLATLPDQAKNAIMNRIQVNIHAFLEENPAATFPVIRGHFGDPRDIASACVGELSAEEMLIKLRIRKKITTAVYTLLFAITLTWVLGIGYSLARAEKTFNGYSLEWIEVGEITPIEEGERNE